jgi:phosphoribosyl-ATP pyrophosphohydrolase/phosphoribosyl-AMP cyclohydrolase
MFMQNDFSSFVFNKYADGLVPAIIQDDATSKVLMLGFMNQEAFNKTIETKLVTFFSRSKQQIWTKGEISKNYLHLVELKGDCDNDTILIKARPDGPVCHTGSDTCFNEKNIADSFLPQLEKIITDRKKTFDEQSYVSSLFKKGVNAIAQKVGEEAVELIIEAKDNNADKFKNEAADLLFHYLILLKEKDCNLNDIIQVLKDRHIK